MKFSFHLTLVSSSLLLLPLLATVSSAVPLVARQDDASETPEGQAIERNGPLPEDTKSVFDMALNSTDYPDTVEAALNGTYAEALAATRDATAAEIEELTFYSALSANVYCPAVIGGLWVCPNCDKTRHLEIVETFNTLVYDMNGIIARDDDKKEIIVVFRGSVSINNWIADLNAVLADYPSVTLARVHAGFLGSWEDCKSTVTSTVESELSSHPDYKLVITGHSLGGAVAVLAALDFHADGVSDLALYTQGQPRVGNRRLAQHIVDTGITYKRAVHARDTVPHVPDNLNGFYHAGEEYWQVSDLTSRVQVCPDGLETSDCANSIAPFTSFVDHTTYFDMSTGICL
ncbi:Alpha/Beta hydrolase protein [Zychaea mexicana]|uniref:Alpha/Beta hydrolase protein n=1 Tax=Zychaea mexicana TaxID=64656 RepID=UPI0022FE9CBD|nr:Alpha/Beta hydrolase protein [Zychaea mexicana]KAI9497403.1 Alpha/Beta hydrolase protein [Zychaea mexicana]